MRVFIHRFVIARNEPTRTAVHLATPGLLEHVAPDRKMELAHRYAALLTTPDGMLREAPPDELADGKSELELQAHWFAGDFGSSFLTATNGERVEVVQFGVWNREAGPDFTDAAVRFPDRPDAPVLRGSVELDASAEDWERHGHGGNPAFDGVVLHLYLRHGARQPFTRTSRHRQVAQVQLDLRQLEQLPTPSALPLARPGRCSAPLRTLDAAQVRALLGAAAQYRLETKNRRWQRLASVHGYDQALFQSLAVTLGYKENKLPFALLAQRLPLKALRAAGESAAALLLGMAGFLEMPDPGMGKDARETRSYLRSCWEHWWPQRNAVERLILPASAWKLRGLRPANHPQRRIAAMAQLALQWPRARALIDGEGGEFTKEVIKFLTGLRDEFWSHHYTLNSSRSPAAVALIGPARATEMLANVFFPRGIAAHPGRWAEYERLPAAQTNRRVETVVARLFEGASDGVASNRAVKTAAQQQGLLQIYEDFCLQDDSDCERCTFPERVRRFEFNVY